MYFNMESGRSRAESESSESSEEGGGHDYVNKDVGGGSGAKNSQKKERTDSQKSERGRLSIKRLNNEKSSSFKDKESVNYKEEEIHTYVNQEISRNISRDTSLLQTRHHPDIHDYLVLAENIDDFIYDPDVPDDYLKLDKYTVANCEGDRGNRGKLITLNFDSVL